MTDVEAAVELMKVVLQPPRIRIRYCTPDELFDLFRKCLAVVREKQG
ncbi:MAG: hypothetical protein IJS32_03170 [Kiritimatiellae bacterium]|nr:hypothetical protein [Kiritimatiellia bacterium]